MSLRSFPVFGRAARWSFLWLACCVTAWAQSDDVARRVQDHLVAGEFGPARDLAGRTNDRAQRDRLFGEIATAQARSGARQGSLSSLSEIYDDRSRASAAGQLASAPVRGWAGQGGGPQADFQPLIDLITSTVKPQSWQDVGGPGAIEEFPGGVYVDAGGLLARLTSVSGGSDLARVRAHAAVSSGNIDVRRKSPLRKVSLTRLEKQLQLRWALGQTPDESMLRFAGLQRLKYVLVYPETGDIVLAGPAGDWRFDGEGRAVSVDTGVPVLHLDDFVTVLRNAFGKEQGRFSCTINPRRENLAKTQTFLTESTKQPLKPGQREGWLRKIRDHVGRQDIEVAGLDPRTRAARILVEADYRMKLVGMGLEEGVLGVTSYLDSIKLGPNDPAPPMDVLRWWFTLNYDALSATERRDAFELKGQGVKVLSENELLNERGERVHTGKSRELNAEFAHSFTKHFGELASRYPIYAELRNVFDLALAAALLRSEDVPAQVGWHLTHFLDTQRYQVELGAAPTEVETIINHRVFHQKHIVAGVSGGVTVDTNGLVKRGAIKTDNYGVLKADHVGSKPASLPNDAWWWD